MNENTDITVKAVYPDGDLIAFVSRDVDAPDLFAVLASEWEFDSVTGETFDWTRGIR